MHAIFKSLGTPTLDIPSIAQPSLSGRRSLYAVTDIPVGESISNLNVKSIRPSFGMHPKYLTDLIGRPVLRPIKAGERMSWDMVD
jgi:sialic acid synthase SpsE